MRLFTSLAVCLLSCASCFAVNYAALPLSFEPNRGQADSDVLFLARGNGYLLKIGLAESRILLHRGQQPVEIGTALVGAQKAPRLEPLEQLPGHSSYFRGQDPSKWVTSIPNFAKVRAAGVYPGIDLVYYGNQSQLEYDFVVFPNADPRKIRMRFVGVNSLRTEAGGNLVLSTAAGEITQQKPVIYQMIGEERRAVGGNFVIGANRTVSFNLGPYDRSKTLVIDPVLIYSSFLGGGGTDEGHAAAVDGNGNLYVAGVTYSTPNGDGDVLIRKIASDGSGFAYIADLGGSGNDIGNGIAVDFNGSAYVGGRTSSTNFPVVNAFQASNFGPNNPFLLRLDPSGSNLIFSTYFGGTGDDRGYAVAIDNQGGVYLAGAASSPDFPTSQGAFQPRNFGGLDCFVAKFDSQGNAIFSTLIGGERDDQAFGIAVDRFGNSYITGQTSSNSYPQLGTSFQFGRQGGLDAFITEIAPDGSALIYSTYIGGSGDDVGNAIAVDLAGDAYITGMTSSVDFPATSFSFQPSFAGGSSDAFVLSVSTNGQNLSFSTFLGGNGTDDGIGIALDRFNNVFITGDSNSDSYPVSTDAVQASRFGGFDAIVSVLDPTGTNLLYSTYLGGSGDDSGLGITLDPGANIYLTGITSSFDFPVTPGVAQPSYGGGSSDAFFAQIGFQGSFSNVPVKAPKAGKVVPRPPRNQPRDRFDRPAGVRAER